MWDQNYKHGFGVFTFQDGEQYIGRFHNDKMIDYNLYGFSIPNMSKAQSERNSKEKNILIKGNIQNPKISNDIKGKDNIDITKSLDKNNESMDKTSKDNLSETNSKLDNSSKTKSIKDININKDTIKGNALEAISEQAELFNMSVLIPDNNKLKDSNPQVKNSSNNVNPNNKNPNSEIVNTNSNNNNNPNNINITKSDDIMTYKKAANFIKEKKEKEFNLFQTLIDIKDLIDCDPDIENNLREVENALLRHLSEMKMWYKYYINKEYQKEENQSQNGSILDDRVSVKDKERSSEKRKTIKPDSKEANEMRERSKMIINAQNQAQLKFQDPLQGLGGQGQSQGQNQIDKFEGVYSNDLSFAMELKDLWKFLRDSNVLSIDFSLAQFNRLFFKGSKNYIEMFMPPEEISYSINKQKIYDNIYLMIKNSKNDFFVRFRERLMTTNITNNLFGQPILTNNLNTHSNTNTSLNNTIESLTIKNNNNINNNNHNIISNENMETHNNNNEKFIETKSNNFFQDNNKEEYSFNDRIHNKRQIILLRHFYEAILRSAYIRYSHISIGLHSKINNLIDTCIKTNINFKKVSKKSQMHTESSINSSVIIDMKQKSFESNFEFFLGNFESRLKFSFKKLYKKSNSHNRLDDMTVTYRYFYDKVIKKSENLIANFDKIKFIELINIYHKDKINISESQKITREQFQYIENLLDIEFIFYEYCELIFFITRKNLTKNNLNETKENYLKEINEIEEIVDSLDNITFNEKYFYIYPKLKHHLKFEDIIATKKAREEELLRKKMEQKRIELERNIMKVEDTNILPEFMEDEDYDEDSSIYSNF
jgi:hypothetical protein